MAAYSTRMKISIDKVWTTPGSDSRAVIFR